MLGVNDVILWLSYCGIYGLKGRSLPATHSITLNVVACGNTTATAVDNRNFPH
jgi:hypothetical protein